MAVFAVPGLSYVLKDTVGEMYFCNLRASVFGRAARYETQPVPLGAIVVDLWPVSGIRECHECLRARITRRFST
jgi:hypothetical protein